MFFGRETFNMYLLYIDPGTGSMLISVLLGAVATLYFFARALIIKAKSSFSTSKHKYAIDNAYPFVIYGEDSRYWNLFKPVIDEFEKRGTPLLYLASDEKDPVFETSYNSITPRAIGEGNKAYGHLRFLSADFMLMTTPGLNVYQIKKSKNVKHYSFLHHASNDITTYRLFGLDHFDSILLNADSQKYYLRKLEEIRGLPQRELVTVGCPYLDVYASMIDGLEKETEHPFTVLLSPSWGSSGLLALYGEKLIGELSKTGWRVIVRPHPQSKISEKDMLARLESLYAANANIVWDYNRNNIYSLSKSDIMISDFSGIVFDYILLFNRPVIYNNQKFDTRMYDAVQIEEELWGFKTLKKAGVEIKEEMFGNIKEIIGGVINDNSRLAVLEQVKKEAWMFPGEAGKRIADFMIGKIKEKSAS
jgi:hypothetical protein